MWQRLKSWAKALRKDVLTLWFAGRHPDTPFAAKLLALGIAAYALSPIDLIPDFIPVLGYLDELILLPIGIFLCLRMIPEPVLAQCRLMADSWIEASKRRPTSWMGAVAIAIVWTAALWWFWTAYSAR